MNDYMKQSSGWYQLDNAAKIIPSTTRGGDTRVFRIVCELKNEVNPDSLQEALDEVSSDFPQLNCVLRKGLFWYYLDKRNIRALVTKDLLTPCSPLYCEGRKNLLYRITYYHNRINLEMFHVLSDGTGAFVFLKELVLAYLRIEYEINVHNDTLEGSSVNEKMDDAFRRFYQRQKGLSQLKDMSKNKAYQIKGEQDENMEAHLIEGTVSASKVKELSHKNNTSVGVMVTALYIAAVIDEMSVREKNNNIIAVSVPVNLRKYFLSSTIRNFFGVINIRFDASNYSGDIAEIIKVVDSSFKDQLQQDKIFETMNSYSALENNLAIKMVPLFIKDIAIWGFSKAAKKGVTSTMSNLGNIELPPEAEDYVEKFAAFMTAPTEQICVSTYKDRMVFGEVTTFETHEIMLNFFRRFVALGIDVEIASNEN